MKLKLALAAATVLSASAAFATPVSLTYSGTASGSESVTVTSFPGGLGAIAGSDNVTSASTFKMSDSTPGGLGDFFAWCVDLTEFLGSPGQSNPYTITDSPFVSTFDFGAAVDRVANLFNASYSEDITTDSEKSAGFQLAIWESVYDNNYSLGSGSFAATSSVGVTGYATDYLAAANGFDGDVAWNVLFLESTPDLAIQRRQHLVTVAPVPLPASALMLLAALGAFGMTRRRQSA